MERPQLNDHNKAECRPMHTAEHLINGEMARRYGQGRAFSAHIERRKSKLDYHLPRPMTAEEVASLEEWVNAAIEADVAVTEEFITHEEAARSFDMTRLPDDASQMLRVVKVGDYDRCLCAGDHVGHTAEIGRVCITSATYREDAGVQRLVFRLDAPAAD